MTVMRNIMIALTATGFLAGCGERGGAADAAEADVSSVENASRPPAADFSAAPTGDYVLDNNHGYITFTYNHQGFSNPFLRWRDWTAALDWNAEDPEASTVTVTIDANSIDSGVEQFDGHLKSADFFNAADYPEITFASTGLKRTGADSGELTGDLTIKGQTRPVTFEVAFNKAGEAGEGASRIGFSARGTVKRSDFGVDKYVPYVSDAVDVIIETEFVSASAAQ